MAYDPTLPASNTPIVSAELRNQFAGLKDLIDQRPTTADMNVAIGDTAKNPAAVALLYLSVSDPPQQDEMQAIADKLDELITALKR